MDSITNLPQIVQDCIAEALEEGLVVQKFTSLLRTTLLSIGRSRGNDPDLVTFNTGGGIDTASKLYEQALGVK